MAWDISVFRMVAVSQEGLIIFQSESYCHRFIFLFQREESIPNKTSLTETRMPSTAASKTL